MGGSIIDTVDGGSGGGVMKMLRENSIFTAGFGLAAVATAFRLGQRGAVRVAIALQKRMVINVELTKNDASYAWFLQWMTAHQRGQLASESGQNGRECGKIISLIGRWYNPRLHYLQVQTQRREKESGGKNVTFLLVPGAGRQVFRYKHAFVIVNRQREKTMDITNGSPFEVITLTTLYPFRSIFHEMLREAHEYAQRLQRGKTLLYTSWGSEWKLFGNGKAKRSVDSVVLAEGLKEKILGDVRQFLENRSWYQDRGIPYRRGYLFYGAPGTGKSSFIFAMAGELDMSIAMLNVSEKGLTDDRLNHLLTNIPPRTLVVLEDADAAFVNRRAVDGYGYAGPTVTFSGLLNALDGVASAEERIIILTTNHVERLDPALIRPGRVDLSCHFDLASMSQISGLWDQFYGESNVSQMGKQRFLHEIQSINLVGCVSPAALQGLFLRYKDDIEGCIDGISQLKSLDKSSDPTT